MENKNGNKIKKNQDSSENKESDQLNKVEETIEPSIEEKLKDSQDKLLRALAEIENQRRRFERETKEAFEYGGFNLARETLSVLDNLQRAYQSIKNDDALKDNKDLNKFLENINIIEKDLISIFERNKIVKIDTKDKKFDPNFHQAMSEIEDDKAATGTILQEIQAGYMIGERLLRPSLVGISKKKEEKEGKKEEK